MLLSIIRHWLLSGMAGAFGGFVSTLLTIATLPELEKQFLAMGGMPIAYLVFGLFCGFLAGVVIAILAQLLARVIDSTLTLRANSSTLFIAFTAGAMAGWFQFKVIFGA